MFDPSVFWPAFEAAGMLVQATVTSGTHSGATPMVGFSRPDREVIAGNGVHLSTEYEMEYQTADLPSLAKDDALTIDGANYKVRQPVFVKDVGNASDGTFRHAILTAT